jgi:CelD/BcsL family acetyltransferase involved in cellulose biosynthesis
MFVIRRDDGHLAGVLPLFIERFVTPLGRSRVAKLVGSDYTLAISTPTLEPHVAADAFAAAARQLFEDDRCDFVHLGPISEPSAELAGIRGAAGQLADVATTIRDIEVGSHTVFELEGGFDAYLGRLSRSSRGNYRRDVKRLNEAFKVEVDVVRDGPDVEREIEAFIDMHQAQWRAINKLGHYEDWPGAREYTVDLAKTLAERDALRLVRVRADDQVVAYNFCLKLNGTYYWRMAGRLRGETWDRHGLGRVVLMKMLETAAAEGVTSVEAGNGHYAYKDRLNAESVSLQSVVVRRRGVLPRLRTRFTLGLADALHLAYYKVWFQRVSPKVRVFRGSLWRSWIRRRF